MPRNLCLNKKRVLYELVAEYTQDSWEELDRAVYAAERVVYGGASNNGNRHYRCVRVIAGTGTRCRYRFLFIPDKNNPPLPVGRLMRPVGKVHKVHYNKKI